MKRPSDCWYLQNKAFFFPPPLEVVGADEAEPLPLSTPCWCLRTHEPVGPDGQEANTEVCDAGRACYRPEVDLGVEA